MYKILLVLIAASLLFLPACSDDETSGSDKNKIDDHSTTAMNEAATPAEEEEDQGTGSPSSKSEDSSEVKQDKKEDEKLNSDKQEKSGDTQVVKDSKKFLLLRPKEENQRNFVENGQTLFTEQVVDQNNEYIQILVTLGSTQTIEIYKWTDDEVTLVYQDFAEQNQSEESILEDFDPNIQTERILGEKADWEIVKENVTVNVEGKKYDNAYVVKTTSDEIVGTETEKTRFYAPGHGLIKEEIVVPGENGYSSTATLKN